MTLALAALVATTSTSGPWPWPTSDDPAESGATENTDTPTDPTAAARADRHAVELGTPQHDRQRPAWCRPDDCVPWQRDLDGQVATAGQGQVFVHDGASLEALDVTTGARRWLADLDELVARHERRPPPDAATDHPGPPPLVPTPDGVLVVGLDRVTWVEADGQVRWVHRLHGHAANDAAVQGRRVLLHTRNLRSSGPFGRRLEALDVATGRPQWARDVAAVHVDRRLPSPLPRHLLSGTVPAETPVAVTTADRRLEALDPATGEVLWSLPRAESRAHVVRRGDALWLTRNGHTRILRLDDGSPHVLARYRPTYEVLPALLATGAVLPDGTRWHRGDDGRSHLHTGDGHVEVLDPALTVLGTDPPVIGGPDRVVGLAPGPDG